MNDQVFFLLAYLGCMAVSMTVFIIIGNRILGPLEPLE